MAAGPITDGTQLNRAPNDVGGLLDTSKGWTLNIPGPSDSGSATKAIEARQRQAEQARQVELAARELTSR